MDWHLGARGPQYPQAAANTELVGKQLGLLLTKMVEKGADARNMHLIGFSLGAHVCGTASESLKNRGHLLGRITGNLFDIRSCQGNIANLIFFNRS